MFVAEAEAEAVTLCSFLCLFRVVLVVLSFLLLPLLPLDLEDQGLDLRSWREGGVVLSCEEVRK